MIKKIIALTVTTLISLTLISFKVSAEEVKLNTIMTGDKPYAPINIIVEKMGGKVQYNENSRTTTYTIGDREVTIDTGYAYCVINGTFVPFEVKSIGGWVVPSFKPPIVKDANMYVPVDFLVKDVGLKLELKDNEVAFEAVENTDKDKVAKVDAPKTSNVEGENNETAPANEDSNKPVNKPSEQASGENATPSQPTPKQTQPSSPSQQPSQPATQPKQTQPTTPAPQPVKQPVYTGSEVKQKLYSLGFVDSGSGLILNPYGAKAGAADDIMSFSVLNGDKDMSLRISKSSPEIDQKIRTILGWILPADGDKLYNVLDNPNLQSQTLEMSGRTITIRIESYGVMVVFSPIK